MQNKTGTVNIQNGETRIIFSEDADLTDVQEVLADSPGRAWFSPIDSFAPYVGSPFSYQISDVFEPGHAGNTTGDRWEAVLNGAIADDDNETSYFSIQTYFTNRFGFPIPASGDVQTAEFLARYINELDALLFSNAKNSYTLLYINDAGGAISLTPESSNHAVQIRIPHETTAYSKTIALIGDGRLSGDRCTVVAKYVSGSNGSLSITNDLAGDLLFSYAQDGSVVDVWVDFVFDADSGWYIEKTGFNQPGTGTYDSGDAPPM